MSRCQAECSRVSAREPGDGVPAFRLFQGACRRGIYDNMKTAVQTVLIGFSMHAGSGMGEGAGREPGRDPAVGSSPRGCASRPTTSSTPGSWTSASPTPGVITRCSGVRGRCSRLPASVSKKTTRAVGRPVEVHACRSHRHPPGRRDRRRACPALRPHQTVYDPWHYVPVLARKPGALRNGAPFKDWGCPAPWVACASGSPATTTATGRWSRSSPPCWRMGWRRWRPPVPRRSLAACAAPTSCSTSSRRRQPSETRRSRRCVQPVAIAPADRLRGVGHGAP